MARDQYLRGGLAIDQRVTADCMERVVTWLDLTDSKVQTAVYPQVPSTTDLTELAHAWMWTAILIADMCELPTADIRAMVDAIRSAYKERIG